MAWPIPTAFIAASLAVAASWSSAPSARAETRVAGLVLEVTGSTQPSLAPYDELPERATVTLGPDAHLVFVHYGTCRQVTISGGSLYIDKARYTLAGGKVEHEDKTNCPREQRIASNAAGAGDTGAAALVMRDAATPLELSGHPTIVLTGARAGNVKSATLRRGDHEIGSMVVTGRKVVWPKDRPALPPGNDYVLLLGSANGAKAVSLTFGVAAAPIFGEQPTVLRLD
jgi:hypothetical protein